MLLPVIILAVLGARIYHVIHLWEDVYSKDLALIPQIWNGGIGIPGAVAGGALGILLYTRSKGLNTARWLDVFAPALLLGQVIGRLGNFVNQELYGPPISLCGDGFPPCLPFGIQIDADHRAESGFDALTLPGATTQCVPLDASVVELHLTGMLELVDVSIGVGMRLLDGHAGIMHGVWSGAARTLPDACLVGDWTNLGVPSAMWVRIIGLMP